MVARQTAGSPADEIGATRGRKRRYAPDVERRMILDAGMRVMRRNGLVSATVSDIIDEAGLSRRAFYRHFEAKDDLVRAIFRDESEAVFRNLQARVAGVTDPVAAIEAFADEYLSIYFDPMKRERVATLTTESVAATRGIQDEFRRMELLQSGVLVEVLRRGARDGLLRSDDPDNDAFTIYRIVQSLGPGSPNPMDRGAAVARAMAFVAGILVRSGPAGTDRSP